MRIISEFRDYYDGVQRFGQADDLLYLRKPSEIESPIKFPNIERSWTRNPIQWYRKFVGFCGVLYPVVYMRRWEGWGNEKPYIACHSLEDADEFCEEHLKKRERESWLSSKSLSFSLTRRQLLEFLAECDSLKNNYARLFDSAPIFVTHYHDGKMWIKYNARLADVEFFRVFDPYQAYQMLYQFLSNQAKPEKPIPHIDDKTMAEAKGFNRWSFRKEPSRK